jgi:hypothetical protein
MPVERLTVNDPQPPPQGTSSEGSVMAPPTEGPMHDRLLYRLTWLAAALSLGHHLDHLIRGNAVGWPLTGQVNAVTASLVVYPVIASRRPGGCSTAAPRWPWPSARSNEPGWWHPQTTSHQATMKRATRGWNTRTAL